MDALYTPEEDALFTAEHQVDIAELGNFRREKRIGLIVPSSNTNAEPDCTLLTPAGVTTHISRSGGYDIHAIPDSDEMRRFVRNDLDNQINLLSDARVDIIGYACTSATLADGPEFDRQFCADIEEKSGCLAVTTAGALVEALNFLGIEKISFTSPYVEVLANEGVDFLDQCGIKTLTNKVFSRELSSIEQGALTPADAYKMALLADHPEAQAIVISCTEYRALEALPYIEKALGKPVVSSNQALMFACLKRLQLPAFEPHTSGGRLFEKAFGGQQ